MKRLLAGLAGIVLLLTFTSAAPIPPDKRFYFPTTVGTKLVYNTPKGAKTFVVNSAQVKDGAVYVTLLEVGTEEPERIAEIVAVSDTGLARHQSGKYPYVPPVWQLKLPHKEGNSWEIKNPKALGLAYHEGKRTVGALEDIEVEAGKFNTIKVVFEGTRLGRPYKSTDWYARDIGVVKTEAEFGAKVLKSFTPAKSADSARGK